MFNLKGKLYKHYNEAGLTSIHTYDFKGQVPEKIRRVIKDSELLSVFEGAPVDWNVEAYRVDWETATDSILDTTSMSYDALGRVTEMVYPEDVSNQRKVLIPAYNRSGALERVQLKESEFGTPITYVDRIAYNARGQKILTALGNGTMTRYLYRNDNFRLLRMKSERYQKYVDGNKVTYEHQSGTTKQNFTYNYDLAGNIISISDTSTGCGIGGSNQLSRSFEYDALYRLLSATGRETAGTAVNLWKDRYRPNDNTVSRAYTQFYEYDKLGNIQELQHVASGGNFTRAFNYSDPFTHNKLLSIDIGVNTYSFTHDVNGNIIQEDTNRHFAYDYADRLKAFYIQANTEEPSTYTQYFYDASGNRVKKISRTQGISSTQTTVYIDGVFEHTITNSSEVIPNLKIGPWKIGYGSGEQNILHIMDDASRIATLRIGDAMGDTTPALKFNLEDHLGSSNLLLDINSSLVSKEEYYPFGETSFGSYGKKRYRFCGKEKDEESGLYYFNARYYNAWTCRFMSIDPMALKNSNKTPYNYCSNNPINRVDPSGMDDTPKGGGNTANSETPPADNIGGIGPPQLLPNGNLKYPDGTIEHPEVEIIGEKQVSGVELAPSKIKETIQGALQGLGERAKLIGGNPYLGPTSSPTVVDKALRGSGLRPTGPMPSPQQQVIVVLIILAAVALYFITKDDESEQVPSYNPEIEASHQSNEERDKERFKELSENEGGKKFSKADKIELENLREKYRLDEKGNIVKIEYKEPIPNLSGKEGAKDVPDWAKGNRPYKGESGSQFAKRLLDEKYGKGNYDTHTNTEYSKIKKWGDRSFR